MLRAAYQHTRRAVWLCIATIVRCLATCYYFGLNRRHFRKSDGTAMTDEPMFGANTLQSVTVDFLDVAQKHPDGIHILYDVCRPTVVITQRGIARDFYRDHISHGRTREFSVLGNICAGMLGEAIGTAYGKAWGVHARALRPSFNSSAASRRKRLVDEEARMWVESLRGHTEIPMRGDGHGVLQLDRFTLRILSKVIYGDISDDEMGTIFDVASQHERLMASLGAWTTRLPGISKVPTALNRRLRAMQNDWAEVHDTLVGRILGSAKLEDAADPCTALSRGIGSVVHELASMNNGGLTHQQMLHNIDELLLTNLDVMFAALGNIYYDLACHPELQEELRAEAIDGHAEFMCADGDLPAIDRFVWESARLAPGVAMSLPEYLPTERELGGFVVPRGTIVSVDMMTINRDPAVFGADANEFRPSRFAENPELIREVARFGFGPRKCLGQHYATLVIRLTLCHLLRSVRLYFPGPVPPLRERRTEGFIYFGTHSVFPNPSIQPL